MIIKDSEINCLNGRLGNPHFFLGVHSLGKDDQKVARVIDTHAKEVHLYENGEFILSLDKAPTDGFLVDMSIRRIYDRPIFICSLL